MGSQIKETHSPIADFLKGSAYHTGKALGYSDEKVQSYMDLTDIVGNKAVDDPLSLLTTDAMTAGFETSFGKDPNSAIETLSEPAKDDEKTTDGRAAPSTAASRFAQFQLRQRQKLNEQETGREGLTIERDTALGIQS